jgi:hypothetical protein
MKQKSMLTGCVAIVGSILLFSCGNNETAKSGANTIPQNKGAEMKPATMTDSITGIHDSLTVKDKDEATEKKEDEKNEKD